MITRAKAGGIGGAKTTMGQTAIEKIAKRHQVEGPERPLRPGDMVTLRPRHLLTHDNTAAVMKKFRAIGAGRIQDPSQPVFALDHDVQNTSPANLDKYRSIEAFAREQGVMFHPAGTGIGHQIMVDHGFAVPGSLVVASDSHANLYGAVGVLGTPVVRTDAAAIWAAGTFWWTIPRTVQVVLEGRLRDGVTGKDVILTLCGMYASGEVRNAAIEFAGEGVATLDIETRMTLANMTTEWGALAGWFPVDRETIRYLRARRDALLLRGARRGDPAGGSGPGGGQTGDGLPREPIREDDLRAWESDPPRPDPDASYAGRITLDLGEVEPQVAGPDQVQATRPLRAAAPDRIRIQKAFLLSCVNGRLGDLEAAAREIRGRHVAPGVKLFLAAASREIQEAAEAGGAWGALIEAGATPLPPGCGPCIGLGEGLLEPGESGISATNRNFKGRMGSRDARCYLASPATVVASAIAGHIVGPEACDASGGAIQLRGGRGSGGASGRGGAKGSGVAKKPVGGPRRRFESLAADAPAEDPEVSTCDGFPASIRGRIVFVPQDHLDTDGIYGKDYTYREDMTREAMARVVMANHDPGFAGRVAPGDVLVGGEDFGTGSSREQAATALQACGIRLVVAASFSRTYLRNAFNNGMPCVECPELVEALRRRLAVAGGGPAVGDAPAAGGGAGGAGGSSPGRNAGAEKTWIPGDEVEVDFTRGRIGMGGRTFCFAPLGPVAQELIAGGGIEAVVRRRLAAVSE